MEFGGPWARLCDAVSPFSVKVWTNRSRFRWHVLTCTRPLGHDGNHGWSDGKDGITHSWDRKGQPMRPACTCGGS